MPTENPDKQTPVADEPKSNLPWSPVLAIFLVFLIFFGTQYLGAILVGVYPALKGWSGEQTEAFFDSSAAGQFVYVLLVEAMTLGFIYWFLRRRQRTLKDIGLLKARLKDFWISLLAYPPYFLVNIAALLIASALLGVDLEQEQQTGFEHAQVPLDLVLTFISLVILPPIVEEIVMRGFLFGSLKQVMPVVKAALITSFLFAIAHLQFGSGAPLLWAAAIDTFILSLVLCYLRYKTGSLWAGIFLHMLKNGLAFYALFILKT